MDTTRTVVATRDAVSRLVCWPAGQTSSSQGECDRVRPPQGYQEGPALCLGRSTAVQTVSCKASAGNEETTPPLSFSISAAFPIRFRISLKPVVYKTFY